MSGRILKVEGVLSGYYSGVIFNEYNRDMHFYDFPFAKTND